MAILRSEESKLHDLLSDQSVVDDAPLDIGLVDSSRDVLMPPKIDAAHDGDSSAIKLSNDIQAARSSRSEEHLKTSFKPSTKRQKTSAMRT